MENFFYSFWWLIFPIGFFIFGAWDRWLAYKRSQARLDLIRSYASQGRDPPPELLRALHDEEALDDEDSAYGPYDRYGRPRHRALRRYWRHRPYWQWRTAIITGAVAAGFWIASEYAELPGLDWPFQLVAIIMTCVAIGHAAAAILSMVFRGR
ncbi:MAG: hypothetical protein JNK30_12395 [Phenylobacterium sp.]|uniref:hypothetical protein n=1 Tax=Phenylobacterium sp. TaxID=1871053 RepID=UPI001A372EBD|nr:hypothetical protein [Phenylobacterium sp.]MBL8772174.1 hypothetical protein [Phenylobacterium sp.]